MTGAALYQKHLSALAATQRLKWDTTERRMVRIWPTDIPPAWEFLDDDRRRYYNELAKRLTPRRARA